MTQSEESTTPPKAFLKPKKFNRLKRHAVYSMASLAQDVGVSTRTVQRWLDAGLPHRKAGHRALIRGYDVKNFVEAASQFRKSRMNPGQHYCFKCRAPVPSENVHVARRDYVASKNFGMERVVERATCQFCGTFGYRLHTINLGK